MRCASIQRRSESIRAMAAAAAAAAVAVAVAEEIRLIRVLAKCAPNKLRRRAKELELRNYQAAADTPTH